MQKNSQYHRTLIDDATEIAVHCGLVNLNDADVPFERRGAGQLIHAEVMGVPALIYVSGCYRDEWIVSVALWPKPGAEESMSVGNAGAKNGEVYAYGWVNRWRFEGRALHIEAFHDAPIYVSNKRLKDIAAVQPSPLLKAISSKRSDHPTDPMTV